MITLTNVEKNYRSDHIQTKALRNINLTIDKGEFLAVMGPSGCGKSTLLNVLGLIDRPSGGMYNFGGADVTGLPSRKLTELRRKSIGFVFQSFNLIGDLTVEENVQLPLLYQGVAKQMRRRRAKEVLELVGLDGRARHRPSQLSGGQQQRVAVARALVGDPLLILADEPTGNLDQQNGEEVLTMLRTLNEQGTTIVMVTHSPEQGARAHRRIDLLDGSITSSTKCEHSH